MAEQTTKRGLHKPDRSDYVSVVSDINDNMDNLDDAVPDSRKVNGHALSDDVTVTKGDVGLGNVDNTSDADKPVSDAVAAKLGTVPSGSTLQGEIDSINTEIGNTALPTTAQTITGAIAEHETDLGTKADKTSLYGSEIPMSTSDNTKVADNITSLKSAKADIIEISDTTQASVKTLVDGADNLPMKLVIGVDPVQDLHGYDNPWPAGGNVNLADFTDGKTIDMDGSITDYTGRIATVNPIVIENGVSYVFKAFNISSAIRGIISVYNGQTLVLRTANIYTGTTLNTSGGDRFYFSVYDNTGVEITVDSAKAMIVRSTDTVTEYSPYANICPISGWDSVGITRTGKNLIDKTAFTGRNTTRTVIDKGVIVAVANAGNNRYCVQDLPLSLLGKTVTIHADISVSSTNYSKHALYFANNDGLTTSISIISGTGSKTTTVEIPNTLPEGSTKIVFILYACTTGTTSVGTSVTYDNLQIELGSSASSYESFVASTTYQITFPSSAGTVYGGTLTVNKDGSGTLVVDRVIVDMGSVSWDVNTNSSVFYKTMVGKKIGLKNIISSIYKTSDVTSAIGNINDYEIRGQANSNQIGFKDPRLTLESGVKSELSGQTIVYEINEAETYDFTAQQIRSLLGTNNLWSDTGDIISVDYSADTKLYVDRQVSEKVSASQRLMELIVTANREDSMKATRAYSSGDLLIVNGTLYKASTSIANGATLTAGTNVTATTVASELASMA